MDHKTPMNYDLLRGKLKFIERHAYGYNIGGKTMGIKTSRFEKIMSDAILAISELLIENRELQNHVKALQAEIEQLRNEHMKIQYNGEELTVQQLCERLERAERKKELALQDIPKKCETCWHLFYTVKGQRCEKKHKVQEFNCIYVMKKCKDWKWRGEDWRGTVER